MLEQKIVFAGITLILIGFLLVFIAGFFQATKTGSEIKSAGILMIGPIPIIFGNKKDVPLLIFLAIILMIAWYLFLKPK